MPEPLTISNTSPLLYLHLIQHLSILQKLYQQVVIPPAVAAELAVGGSQGINVPDPHQIDWFRIEAVQAPQLIPVITDLGAGEAEVIGLALEHPGSLIFLDDQLGRRIARLNGLKLTGTLGIVVKAKQAGHLKEVKPLISALQQAGLWLHHSLIDIVLKQAGEDG